MHVYVVDDETDLAASLTAILVRAGHEVRSFVDGQTFLDIAAELAPGCVLLDLRLPDVDGLQVLDHLIARQSGHAVVLLTGFGAIPDAVHAMRAGAVDFLSKPYRREELKRSLELASRRLAENAARDSQREKLAAVHSLTARELDVLRALASGKPSKVAAHELGLSVRTIDMHRARIVKRLEVGNIAAALVMVKEAQLL